MNLFWNAKNILILSALGLLFSCVSSKNIRLEADTVFDDITKNMEEIQQADKLKFTKIEQFFKIAKKNQLKIKDIKQGELLFESVKQKQLNLEKMTSEEIDKYDQATEKLIGQLSKIQQADAQNESLKKQLSEIQKIDNQDLPRRIRYDRAVMAWNKLFKKSKKKLQKSKKYKQAQLLPVFTIEE